MTLLKSQINHYRKETKLIQKSGFRMYQMKQFKPKHKVKFKKHLIYKYMNQEKLKNLIWKNMIKNTLIGQMKYLFML